MSYELYSQIFRASAFTFIITAAFQTEGQWINVATIGLSFFLGLLRLLDKVHWRRTAQYQVNLLVLGSFLLLFLAEVLPTLKTGSDHDVDGMVLGATASLGAAITTAFVSPRPWTPPSPELDIYQGAPEPQPSPEETCSWFVYFFTYSWLSPMFWKGWRGPVVMDDLPPIPWYDEPLLGLRLIQEARKKGGSTFWTILYYQRNPLLSLVFWSIMNFMLELVAPVAMYQLLAYLSDPEGADISPILWLFLMFAGPVLRSVANQQYAFVSTRMAVRLQSAMTQELYHRAMTCMEVEEDILHDIMNHGKGTAAGGDKGARRGNRMTKATARHGHSEKPTSKSTSSGRLANLMAADIASLHRARDCVLVFMGLPVGVTMAFVLLYQIVGWTAFAGVACLFIPLPIVASLTRMMNAAQRDVKHAQDSRISKLSEYLGSIKAIKYFAWEDAMVRRIGEAREGEQRSLWRVTVFWILLNQMAQLSPLIALLVIFSLYVGLLNLPLTAPVAFTTLTLIMTMRRNLMLIASMSNTAIAAAISAERLDKFFSGTTPLTNYPVGPLLVQNATFRRNKNAAFTLRDVSVDFVQGGLNAVTGASGSGKTTLLLAILGETILESGSVTRPGDVAFASQTPWLQSDTVRNNILFHTPFEEARYVAVIEACCLAVDLRELPKGDQAEIGENGTALSGGQRSRVALARALYSKASVLLLDDVFSALDAKTAAQVWRLCFCGDMLKGRTVVLVTQMPWTLAQADFALTLENGAVKAAEQNIAAVRNPIVWESEENARSEERDEHDGNGTAASTEETESEEEEEEEGEEAEEDGKPGDIEREMQESHGSARWSFFSYMLWFGGRPYAIFCLFMTVLANGALIGTSYWLSVWVNVYSAEEAVNIAFYLGVYAGFAVGACVIEGFSNLVYVNGAWHAARKLHQKFLQAVMAAPLPWWKTVPVGRVVNRFSRDISLVDDQLIKMLQTFLMNFVKLFFSIGAVASILPIFSLPALLVCILGSICGEMYTRTAVTVKRLVSSSQSPVFSQFGDTLAGLAVIRARAGMPGQFGDRLAEKLRLMTRAMEANFNCNRWISIRTDFITAVVSLMAGLIAVSKAGTLATGLVGFSLTNATGLTDTILQVVRSMNNLEVELQSFERVKEYSEIPPEEETDRKETESGALRPGRPVPDAWPRTGAIELRNVTVRYDPDGPDILKDVDLKFEAGERVAVVGRTGSGKSTLVLSLLRFTHVVSGQILYDGVDITAIPRKRLRQALTIIPQDAVLFQGTVGSNFDLSGDIPAPRLQQALQACSDIASFQFHDTNGNAASPPPPLRPESAPSEATPLLNGAHPGNGTVKAAAADRDAVRGVSTSTPVLPNGENFSHGQRQVLSLCRALVRSSKLMLLDEATASMDYETDRGIQAVLRRQLSTAAGGDPHRTLVTIAHRLRTTVDYDKVVVMGAGRVLEVGSPRELCAARGPFWGMVCHSGEGDDLERLMLGGDGGTGE